MNIVCLDMEGVLVPEIWIAFRRSYRNRRVEDKLRAMSRITIN